jgi:diacylglycerol kinase (ATP)
MNKARVVHNPNAGAGSFTPETLRAMLQAKGYHVTYASAKEPGWAKWDEADDMVIVAGGDGTVRKVVKSLLERPLLQKQFSVAVLPLGTANNISKTFYQNTEHEAIVDEWQAGRSWWIDIGRVQGVPKEGFFMEGMGVGVFPSLMKDMQLRDLEDITNPADEVKLAQEVLCKIVKNYKPHHADLHIDGKDYSGEYVLIEIMNIRSVGPNLVLSPDADAGDGQFEVVMIKKEEREKLAAYVKALAEGSTDIQTFNTVKAQNISLCWGGKLVHVDDKLLKVGSDNVIRVELRKGLIQLLTGQEKQPEHDPQQESVNISD